MSFHPTIPFLIIDVARLLRRRFEAATENGGLGLTAGEARTLLVIKATQVSRQAQLAERMNVEPMTLVGFLDRLEARGLIERVTDPKDRRAKMVHMLPAAAPFIDRIDSITAEIRSTAMADLSQSDCDRIFSSLLSMRDALTSETDLQPA